MSNPITRRFTEPILGSLTDWDVRSCRAALQSLSMGRFQQAAKLADAMYADDRIATAIDQRINGLLGCPLVFTPAQTPSGETISQEIQVLYSDMFPENVQAEILRYTLLLGACPAELVWERVAPKWKLLVNPWHPQFLEDRQYNNTGYWVQTTEGYVAAVPGEGKFAVFTLGGKRPWLNALVRRLAIAFLIRNFATRDWARSSEVHGLPAWVAKYPQGASPEDIDRFMRSLENLGQELRLELPQGENGQSWGIDLLEAKANNWETFSKLLDKTETNISIAVLGQNLTSEVKEGSRAAATVHNEVRLDYKRADAAQLNNCTRQQIIKPFVLVNYGNMDAAPSIQHDVTPLPTNTKIEEFHLKAGVVKRNEVRSQLGLAPLPPEQGGEDFITIGGTPTKSSENALGLSSRMGLQGGERSIGFINGQLYTDAVADHAQKVVSRGFGSSVNALLSVVKNATSYDDLKRDLQEIFEDFDPDEFSEVMTQALTLANFSGQYAVIQDG